MTVMTHCDGPRCDVHSERDDDTFVYDMSGRMVRGWMTLHLGNQTCNFHAATCLSAFAARLVEAGAAAAAKRPSARSTSASGGV